MSEVEYRVSWEMPDAVFVAEMEARRGERVWEALSPEAWDLLPWKLTQRVSRQDDTIDQAEQLLKWAKSHEQPIRNVVIEKRLLPVHEWTIVQQEVSTPVVEAPDIIIEPVRLQDTEMAKQIKAMHEATGHFIAIDADCPGCGYGERRFNGTEFSCHRCDYVSEERDR